MDDTPYRLIRDDEANVLNMSNLISFNAQQSDDNSVNMTYDLFMKEEPETTGEQYSREFYG